MNVAGVLTTGKAKALGAWNDFECSLKEKGVADALRNVSNTLNSAADGGLETTA